MIENKLKKLEKENEQLKAQLADFSSMNSKYYLGQVSSYEEINLRELINVIWQGKWIIISVALLFFTLSILLAFSLSNEYKSTAILAPASSSSSSQLSKLAGQFGGLASLAGINVSGSGKGDKTTIAIEIIKTWGFLEKFIQSNNIEPELFAVTGWDSSTNSLIYDTEIYNPNKEEWIRNNLEDSNKFFKPSSWNLYKRLKKRISISQDKTSGLINLSVDYYSPSIAKEWVDKLVVAINLHIQKQDREEAAKSIAYLNRKIKETNIADMQSVFYQLIEEQTKTLMLAEVSDEYVFKVLSPAKVPEEKFKPKRVLICALGTLLGVVLAVIFVLISHFRNKDNQ
ncbi:Wzz/FepE/Etk N-terminal domain-containing protein [Pleionea sediminis]|uniref:Wzz/FepE/Etk N-terminal domain-containing protein n=1 Tax=Pleionea sediminis TaxID=2569479 RepID=UPI001186C2A6|nr:Wzz/FepE/Etk N-terminal domain-containing protein [Pleionea sediminis]